MSQRALFIHSEELTKEGYPPESPFNTRRAGEARRIALSMGLFSEPDACEQPPVKATREELEQFHTPAYIDAMLNAEQGHHSLDALSMGLGKPDCPIFRGCYDYVSLAVGASLTGARSILEGQTDIAFNPSGGFHHSGPALAAGFCYMNDVVLAILEFTKARKRVLFLDLDVHHGDGVLNAFYHRDDVMTISIHESGKTLFPGTGFVDETGAGKGAGYSVNVPLPAGTHDNAYQQAFKEAALPLISRFDPDVFVLELGMDGLLRDPLAHLSLTNNVYADIVATIVEMRKPVLATGGGGYNFANTARGWALMWSVLSGAEDHFHAGLTVGGMMLQNAEWAGGLRDRAYTPEATAIDEAERETTAVIEQVRSSLFPMHGLDY